MWRPIAQSLQGPSHLAAASPCQDAHGLRLVDGESGQILLACVADGAGSAEFSDTGSAIASDAMIEHAVGFIEAGGQLEDLQRDDVLRWCEVTRERIQQEAAARDCDIRELACTLSMALLAPTHSCFFQIGDGAIVLRRDGVYGVVFWPQTGEYANSTNFLTSTIYDEQLEFLAVAGCFSDIALMTDGLERLALRFDIQTPHVPFFDPFFRALRAADDHASLNPALQSFLGSESVQERSDDDKTLILASRIEPKL